MRFFKRQGGWYEEDLFNSAYGHFIASETIFSTQDAKLWARLVPSGGYLLHIGTELVLKGCLLYQDDEFPDCHNLNDLYKKICFLKLERDEERIIKNIDKFFVMRYPHDWKMIKEDSKKINDENVYGEIGDTDWIEAIRLMCNIQNQMPKKLSNKMKDIFNFTKLLDQRKILKENNMLWRIVPDV